MNLDKAIKILEYHEPSLTHAENPDVRLALKLGIEALKRVREYRPDMGGNDSEPLPGETED